MAIKVSDLYSSLWTSCDQLRGGMEASHYRDYALFMLSIKHAYDKYERTAAAVLTDMDAEPTAPEQRREKTCALKRGMMRELLTGRTRLV